jgi:hypothetical protein
MTVAAALAGFHVCLPPLGCSRHKHLHCYPCMYVSHNAFSCTAGAAGAAAAGSMMTTLLLLLQVHG